MKEESKQFARYAFKRAGVSLPFDLEDVWSDFCYYKQPRRYSIPYILHKVSEEFDVPVSYIMLYKRHEDRTQIRHISQYIMDHVGHTNKAIADFFGHTHGNISIGIRKIKEKMTDSVLIKNTVEKIILEL